jgi:hypothetical protein
LHALPSILLLRISLVAATAARRGREIEAGVGEGEGREGGGVTICNDTEAGREKAMRVWGGRQREGGGGVGYYN